MGWACHLEEWMSLHRPWRASRAPRGTYLEWGAVEILKETVKRQDFLWNTRTKQCARCRRTQPCGVKLHKNAWRDLLCLGGTSVTVTSEKRAKRISYQFKCSPIDVNRAGKSMPTSYSHTLRTAMHRHTQGEGIHPVYPDLVLFWWYMKGTPASTCSLGKETAGFTKQLRNSSHQISIPQSPESAWFHQDLS